MRYRELSTVGVLAVVYGIFAALAPQMLEWGTITTVLRQIAPVAIAGAAITLVMVAGSLDLSVGGTIALTGVVAAGLAAADLAVPLAFILAVLIGGIVGLVNAFLVVGLRINSVIATLGTLYVATGAAFLLSDGRARYTIPDSDTYASLGNGKLLGIPTPVWMMAGFVLLFWAIQRFTTIGRHAVAIGSNESAALLSGVRIGRMRIILFVAAGLAAGVSGILLGSQFNGDPKIVEEGWEFSVIVAAVLGGTSLAGGKGSVIGTLIGAAIVGIVSSGLNILGVYRFWQYVIMGIVLVIAVAIDDRLGPFRARFLEALQVRKRPKGEGPPESGRAKPDEHSETSRATTP